MASLGGGGFDRKKEGDDDDGSGDVISALNGIPNGWNCEWNIEMKSNH